MPWPLGGSVKKEKKPVIVEHRYIGQFKFDDWGTWNKWHAYRDLKTAESVVEQLTRKFGKSFEFRVKPPNTASTGQAASGSQSDDNSKAACR